MSFEGTRAAIRDIRGGFRPTVEVTKVGFAGARLGEGTLAEDETNGGPPDLLHLVRRGAYNVDTMCPIWGCPRRFADGGRAGAWEQHGAPQAKE